MADLNPLSYGTVTGRFLAIVGDDIDALDNPDAAAMEGTVTFTAAVDWGLVANAVPVPATIFQRPIVVTLDADGYVNWNGNLFIKLVATDDPNVNPSGFTYTVSFDLSYAGVSVPYPAFSFQLPANTTVDLSTVAPVASGGGTLTIAGPPGPSGSALPVASAAEAQAMTLSTKTITPLNLGDVSATAATASRLIKRDASGRAQVATPSASADIATKGYVDAGAAKDYGTGTTLIDAVTSNEIGWVQINDVSALYGGIGSGFGSISTKSLVISQLADYGGDGEFTSDAELFQTLYGNVDTTPHKWSIYRKKTMSGGVWGSFGTWQSGGPVWEATEFGSNDYRIAASKDFSAGFVDPRGFWLNLANTPLATVPGASSSDIPGASIGQLNSIFSHGYESGGIAAQDNAAPTTYGTMPAAVVTGTGTNYDVTSRSGSDYATRFTRYDYLAASASTTAVAGVTYPLALTKNNGFMLRARFAVTGGVTTNTRLFCGVILSNTMSDVEPDTMLSCFGLGYKSADANFTWYSNDATLSFNGTQATTVAVSTTLSQIVDMYLVADASNGFRGWARINSNGTTVAVAQYTQTSSPYIPAANDELQFMLKASAGGTSAQPRVSLMSLQYTTGLF